MCVSCKISNDCVCVSTVRRVSSTDPRLFARLEGLVDVQFPEGAVFSLDGHPMCVCVCVCVCVFECV